MRRLASISLVVGVGCAAVMTAAVPALPPVHRAVVWGVVLLVSFAGWGSVVARAAVPGHPADLGLRLAWGLSAIIALGGVALWWAAATPAVLLSAVALGVLAAALGVWNGWNSATTPPPAPPRSWLTAAVLLGVGGLVVVQWYVGAGGGRLSTDDFNAYLVYPQKILSTGTLLERFSLRRLSSFGGQSLLQAFTLLGAADPRQISLFDHGICLAITLALVIGDRARWAPGLWLLPLALLVMLPNIRGNSASQMSGAALLLALYRTAVTPLLAAAPRRRALLLGLVAGAATTLRQWYLVAAVAFLGLLYLPDVLAAVRAPAVGRARLGDLATAIATMVVVLLPWSALAYLAVGTPLYPLFAGNYRAEYGSLIGNNPRVDRWTFLWRNAAYGYPVRMIGLFMLAALVLPWRDARGALAAFALASLLGFLVIVAGFPLSDPISMSRYYFAFFVSGTLAVLWQATARPWSAWRARGWRATLAVSLAAGAALAEMAWFAPLFRVDARAGVTALVAGLPPEDRSRYRALQAAIPPGAPLIVMFDHPYLFDFDRNPIEVIDLPGQVSPPPGMRFDADDALATYLTDQGFRYLAFVKPQSSMNQYRREGWRRMLGPPPSVLWGRAAPIILQALDRFESLGRNRWRLYDDGRFIAVDLAARMP